MGVSVSSFLKPGTGANDFVPGNDPRIGRFGGLVPAANKMPYYDAAGAAQLEDRISGAAWTVGLTCAVPGDLSVVLANADGAYDKRGPMVDDIWWAPTITATYTNTAWTANTALAVGVRRTNGGNVYEVTTAGTTAASGGPTGTGASITDGTVTWKYISLVTSGDVFFTGFPFTADNGGTPSLIPYVNGSAIAFPGTGTGMGAIVLANTKQARIIGFRSAAGTSYLQMSAFTPGSAYVMRFRGRYRALS